MKRHFCPDILYICIRTSDSQWEGAVNASKYLFYHRNYALIRNNYPDWQRTKLISFKIWSLQNYRRQFFVAFQPYKLRSVCLSTHQLQIRWRGEGGGGVSKHWSDNDTWRLSSCHHDGGDISLIASCVSTVCNQRRSCVSPRTIISRDLQRGGVQVAAPPPPPPGSADVLVTISHLYTIAQISWLSWEPSPQHHHCCTALPSNKSAPVLIRI